MATQRRKVSPPKKQPEQPAGLRWQQPPAKSRKQIRRVQTTAAHVTAPGSQQRPAPTAKRQPQRLAISWQTYLRIALISLVVIGSIVGFWELLRLPQLTVTASTTQIGGSQRISVQDVFAASQVEDRNILLIRPAEVAQRVAEMPGIASVDVHVRLPSQVLIDVQEHQPLVVWRGITTTLWLSADGGEVPQAGDPPPLSVNDLSGTPLGESLPVWLTVLPQLAAIRQASPDLTDLSYGPSEGLYFRSPEGWTVWLGKDEIVAKLALLDAARQEITARGERPSLIDIRDSARQAFWR